MDAQEAKAKVEFLAEAYGIGFLKKPFEAIWLDDDVWTAVKQTLESDGHPYTDWPLFLAAWKEEMKDLGINVWPNSDPSPGSVDR
jgi:hypothetical protein